MRLATSAVLAALAWTFVVVVVGPAAAKPATPPEPGPEPGRNRAWFPLAGTPLLLRSGAKYRACIELPFYVPSALVTETKVREYAERQGFGDVTVWKDAPAGWPASDCDGDVYVEATWMQGYRDMDRPSALVGAWELRDL